ncbi:hypothetical protein SAMN03159335_06197 [Burkholderia cepacia]|uniref:hypothetical protein n=1 Tax=Burkholderia cepacia TaxID=292 RepID=UPI0008BD0FC5|nr:hypothetical protein [Burkholderia cepacia]SEU40117.1 hypothetical protein SAMN03159335_06197 [Burkholderia cepacia]
MKNGEKVMPVVKTERSKSAPHGFGDGLLVLGVCALIVFCLFKGVSAFSRWSVDRAIDRNEAAIQSGKIADESTVVLVAVPDKGWAYYKFGQGTYAKALRMAGLGCRFYYDGTPYTFEKHKTTDPIPFNYFRAGSRVVGQCDASTFGDAFELSRAQQ